LDGQHSPLRKYHGRETLSGHNMAFISDEYERINAVRHEDKRMIKFLDPTNR
jgi:hypothetical protein